MLQKGNRERREKEVLVEVVMIRHGETAGNRAGRYVGRRDEALCEEGRTELQRRKREGKYPTIEKLYSSPMLRCLETGQILYAEHQPEIIEDWKEMDFGIFEGRSYREMESWPQYQAWIDSGGTMPFPQGESREAFGRRVMKGLGTVLGRVRRESVLPARIGVLIHGGVIMSLMSQLEGGDFYSYLVGNGKGYRCLMAMGDRKIRLVEYEKL